MKKNMFLRAFVFLVGLGFITSASAVTEPGAFSSYLEVLLAMISGTAGNLVMVLILAFGALKAYQVGDKTPLLWAAGAVLVIAAAPLIAPNLTSNITSILGF
ncbi:hypothetical protein [Sulfurimonas sp.]|uniref:hypothetical protein n=1 Tax=Sulfurimonas sp. TaxID=2022749 RepID=UPI0025E2A808|nr:hypothetical protein [Sulfurimonas sp.]MBW6487567.1 hypothetical protein [Sulfurimonas sp.]